MSAMVLYMDSGMYTTPLTYMGWYHGCYLAACNKCIYMQASIWSVVATTNSGGLSKIYHQLDVRYILHPKEAS